MQPEDVLAALDAEQRAAAVAVQGPVCILAGAGTGKTRTITHRIAYAVHTGVAQPGHVLAVTFTARAAGELRSRLRGLEVDQVQARTFHAAALRQLSYFWPRIAGGEMPGIVESKIPLVARAADRARLRVAGAELRDVTAEIEWAKARLVGPDGFAVAAAAAGRSLPRDAGEIATIYERYEELKHKSGQVDFDDLLLLMAAAIEEHEDVAGEVRSRYRHFVVDEYQDVNPLQQRLLDAWLGDRDDLCVVGDDDQTIYSFTGASHHYLLRFTDRYPDATVVRLRRDYRSTPQVVELANRVIAGGPRKTAKRLEAQLPPGPEPTLHELPDEPAEAAYVAERIRALLAEGVPVGEIAVLYRINAQSEVYEAAFATAGIPYVIRGGQRFFDRPEIREALHTLRAATRAGDQPLERAGPGEVGELLAWDAASPPAGGAARDRWEAVGALVALSEELGAPPLAAVVAELEQRAADQHAPAAQGVTLASLHAAKGLEWDAVFLVGLVDGTMPIQHADTAEQVDEERRLLYVGVTRARRHLTLTWALSRQPGGRGRRRRSRFLDAVSPAAPPAAGSRKPRGIATCRTCGAPLLGKAARNRRCATCPADLDEELFEKLRDWRRGRAAELGQPAYCVFTDATLTAIAETRPATLDDLGGVPGVGAVKLEKFGSEVLSVVADR